MALAHFDAGTGDAAANRALAAELTPVIVPLLCRGGVLVSDPADRQPPNWNRCRCRTAWPRSAITFIAGIS